jgi:hypothetical protein
MLRTLPIHDPGRLVELLFKAPAQDHFNAFDWRNYQHYRENNHVFSGLIAASDTPFVYMQPGLARQRRGGELVLLEESVQLRLGGRWKANQRWQPPADHCRSCPQRLRWPGAANPQDIWLPLTDNNPSYATTAILAEVGAASDAGCIHRAGPRRDEHLVAVDPGGGIQNQ